MTGRLVGVPTLAIAINMLTVAQFDMNHILRKIHGGNSAELEKVKYMVFSHMTGTGPGRFIATPVAESVAAPPPPAPEPSRKRSRSRERSRRRRDDLRSLRSLRAQRQPPSPPVARALP